MEKPQYAKTYQHHGDIDRDIRHDNRDKIRNGPSHRHQHAAQSNQYFSGPNFSNPTHGFVLRGKQDQGQAKAQVHHQRHQTDGGQMNQNRRVDAANQKSLLIKWMPSLKRHPHTVV